jgi:HPt (histidine-containing phosphotransfer) domain-containing protein
MNFKEIAQSLDLEEDEYKDLIKLFIETTESNLKELEGSIASQDAEGIFKTAHRIKGAAFNLELNDIAVLAKEIETRGKNDQLADIPPLFTELKNAFGQLSALTAE